MFASMLVTVGVLGVLGLFLLGFVIWFVNRRAAGDMFAASRAQVGKWGDAAINADPQAVVKQEIKDAKDQLNKSITDLEESQAMVALLEAQVVSDNREYALRKSDLDASLIDDPEDKLGKAESYMDAMETAKNRLETNTTQLTQAKTIYSNNLNSFNFAKKKVDDIEKQHGELAYQLKGSEINAKLANLAKKFNVNVDSLGDRLKQAQEATQQQIAKNNAVVTVQTDLGMNGLAQAQEEERLRKAQVKMKLEKYKKDHASDGENK